MKIIVVTGMPGSGKGEFVELAKARGLPVVSMGDTVREWTANVYHLELNSKNVGLVAREERIRHGAKLSGTKIPLEEFDDENRKKLEMDGFDIWAIRMIPKIKAQNSDIVIVDGVRGEMEVEEFKKHFGNDLVIVAIITDSAQKRYDRMLARGRRDDPNAVEELKLRDERETYYGLPKVIEKANIKIPNETTIDDFRNDSERVLDGLLGKKCEKKEKKPVKKSKITR